MKVLKSLPHYSYYSYLYIIPFLLPIHNLNGQGTVQTQLNPDCPVVSITVTLTNSSGSTLTVPGGNGFDNRSLGCQTYTLQYVATATTGSLTSIAFQAAGGAAVPGTFGNFGGTVATGINPNTSNTGAISTFNTGCTSSSACTVNNSWLNVLITRGTFVGTIQLVVYGWKNGSAKAGGGGGGGGGNLTILGTANQVVVTGAGCIPTNSGTCTISLPGGVSIDSSGDFVTPGSITSGSGSGITGALDITGATSAATSTLTVDDNNVATLVKLPNDSTSGLYAVTSPSSTPTSGRCAQFNGTGTQIAPAAAACGSGGGGSAGGGVLGYSATALTLPTAGTTFLAPVGGALASTTEANVTANAPAAAAISNMYVTLSAAPGTGNTVAFTFRDAGSSTAVTCTISGASATSCQDTTHSFTPVVGDALAVQVVTTGTVVIAPAIKIIAEYGVTGGGGSGTNVPFGFTYTALVPGNWSLVGSGSSVSTITGVTGGNALLVTAPTGGGTNGPFAGITTPATGTNYTHTFVFYGVIGGSGNVSDQICPVFTDGTKWEGPCILYQAGGPPGVGVTSIANSTFANGGSLQNANGATTTFSIVAPTVPLVFMLVKTGTQLQGYYCPDGQNVVANCFLLFTDTTPFLTPNAVALIGGARGGSKPSIAWFESYQDL